MNGYVLTPDHLVDKMVRLLFRDAPPKPTDWLLDPGCADGRFIAGVLRWCSAHDAAPPRMIGVEVDPSRAVAARERFRDERKVEIVVADYLTRDLGRKFRYVIGNPPYVPLEHISEAERLEYRRLYTAAFNRFDLYMLFFERGLADMERDGRLAFVTPEKFTYVESAGPLRRLMTTHQVEQIEMIAENAFPGHTTYPAVTVITSMAKASRKQSRFGTEPNDPSIYLRVLLLGCRCLWGIPRRRTGQCR
jgi:tRNA1(Val) A37 N6-methylase TrmN6